MQITININNADDTPSVVIDNLNIAAPAAAESIPNIVPLSPQPMDNGARQYLFGAWGRAFSANGDGLEREERHRFTRTVLGLPYDADVSWRNGGPISQDQAYYMARVLNEIANILT